MFINNKAAPVQRGGTIKEANKEDSYDDEDDDDDDDSSDDDSSENS